jgi:hypothetical protein
LRPHTAIHSITPAPSGSADFQPASAIRPAWVRRRLVRMLGARASRPHTAMRHLGARASSPHTATHHLGARASSPHAGSTGVQPAYSDTPLGSAGFQPASSDMPPGCAGFQPACRVHRHCARIRRTLHHLCTAWVRGRRARIRRYTPSPLHRLGAQASRPHAGCTGIAPAYSDTPHHPCTVWVRGLPARMPRAEGHTWQRQWVLDQSLTS